MGRWILLLIAVAALAGCGRPLSYSPDGSRLALTVGVGSNDHVGVLDIGSGKVRWIDHRPTVSAVAWSPNGRTIAYSTPYGVALHEVDSGQARRVALAGEHWSNGPSWLTWSRTGRTLLAAGSALAWIDGETAEAYQQVELLPSEDGHLAQLLEDEATVALGVEGTDDNPNSLVIYHGDERRVIARGIVGFGVGPSGHLRWATSGKDREQIVTTWEFDLGSHAVRKLGSHSLGKVQGPVQAMCFYSPFHEEAFVLVESGPGNDSKAFHVALAAGRVSPAPPGATLTDWSPRGGFATLLREEDSQTRVTEWRDSKPTWELGFAPGTPGDPVVHTFRSKSTTKHTR